MITQDREKVKQVSHNNPTQQATANPYSGKIAILAVHPCHQQGSIRAFFDFRIGNALEVYGAKFIQEGGKRGYIRLPDRKRTDGPGYAPIIKSIDAHLIEAIGDAFFAAWQNGGAQ